MDYDLLVIGAGAAGMAAARTGKAHGARVAVISEGPVGGECTFVGCIPSKTLIEAAGRGDDFATAMRKVRTTVARVAATETADVLRGEGIAVIEGHARLTGREQVDIAGRRISFRRLVLATGSRPAIPPIPGINDVEVLTNENVFDLTERPESLLVVGGGPIGVELAQAFARLGTTVTLIETENRLLGREEPEASGLIEAALSAEGVKVLTKRKARSIAPDDVGLRAQLDDGTILVATRVLVATGREANTTDLGIDHIGVATDNVGRPVTDSRMRTSVSGIYAAGDVTGRCAFTHAADEMGRVAATNALARIPYRRFSEDSIPVVTFSDPEVARVGLTEHQAASSIPGARVAYMPLDQLDRAVTAGRTDGYIKLVAAPRRGIRNLAAARLVGATIVAARAGEMIAVPTLAVRNRMLLGRLALTVQAYPTWSLGIRQAAAQFFLESTNRPPRT